MTRLLALLVLSAPWQHSQATELVGRVVDSITGQPIAARVYISQGPSPLGPRVDRGYEPITVDATHVMFPRNTEYEIFSVHGKPHVLGAVFLLNHKTVFQEGVPPMAKIAAQAHREGALLDLDKHNWPWSMMLVPVARIDLYELANNSI